MGYIGYIKSKEKAAKKVFRENANWINLAPIAGVSQQWMAKTPQKVFIKRTF